MSPLNNEILNRLTESQEKIWNTVSMAVGEATGFDIAFGSPITTLARTADLYSEFNLPMMVIQFAFTNRPESMQAILIPQNTVIELLSTVTGTEVLDVDENAVAELRSCLEGIVQGICLSLGTLRNETVVASGLSLRYQIFAFPPNLQRASECFRTQVAVAGGQVHGGLTWLLDVDTAQEVFGLGNTMEESIAALPSASGGGGSASPYAFTSYGQSERNNIDLLLDVPLQVTVELGRVKMLVREVVELATGSIVEIDKAAGEPVDVMVNGRLVARGEVVVIEDNFGVRITEILNPSERLGGRLEAA